MIVHSYYQVSFFHKGFWYVGNWLLDIPLIMYYVKVTPESACSLLLGSQVLRATSHMSQEPLPCTGEDP